MPAIKKLGPGKPVEIEKVKLVCSHCGHDRFHKGKALLNTRTRSLAGIDFTDDNADVYACDKCGHLEWFL